MKSLFLLSMAFCCLVAFIFLIKAPLKTDTSPNVFSSNVYPSYHRQLQSFLREHPLYPEVKNSLPTTLNQKMKSLISLLESPLQVAESKSALHITFVSQLREAIEESVTEAPEDRASKLLLDALVDWIYVGASLNQELEQFLYRIVNQPKKDILLYLRSTLEWLRHNHQFAGGKPKSSKDDSYRCGNLPSVIFKLKKTRVIRCAMPIIGRLGFPWLSPRISPEFIHFVSRSPSHLYVNLTRRYGREAKGAKKVEELERKVTNLFVVTLDKDSSFYQQNAVKTQNYSAALFKRAFFNEMTAKESNYYWSTKLDLKSWFEELASLLDYVHDKFFSSQAVLKKEERKAFIELTYIGILDKLIDTIAPDSMNVTCHQGIDRAPSLLALWMLQRGSVTNATLAALVLAPPLLFRNRCSHPFRVKRLIAAAARLA